MHYRAGLELFSDHWIQETAKMRSGHFAIDLKQLFLSHRSLRCDRVHEFFVTLNLIEWIRTFLFSLHFLAFQFRVIDFALRRRCCQLLTTSATICSSISTPLSTWSLVKLISYDVDGVTIITRFFRVWSILAMTN